MDINKISDTVISSLKPYNPEKIGIFGSYARNEQNAESDLDILVRFKNVISFLDLVGIEQELSETLGLKIDLVTERALKNEKLKEYIYKDLKIIYE